MSLTLVHYPNCSTSRKAKAWLEENGVDFAVRHIVEQTPTRDELLAWRKIAGLDKKRFVNTSGKKYRELGLKQTIGKMGEAELFDLLAGEGMLVKRPILVGDGLALVGFRQPEWEAALGL